MARPKGSPNKNERLKTDFIKFRVSEDFKDLVEQFRKHKPFWTDNKSDAALFRWLILEGMIKFCDYDFKDKVQQKFKEL